MVEHAEGGGESGALMAETVKLQKMGYRCSDDLLDDARHIIEGAQRVAHQAVNVALVRRNWLLGKRFAEEELMGEDRAEYGSMKMKELSRSLTKEYGKGFAKSNLYQFLRFFKEYPDIFQTPSGKCPGTLLSWSHYTVLLGVSNLQARKWYEREAIEQSWGFRTLRRNIETQYYHRLLASQHPDPVRREMERKTEAYQADKLEFVKNPVIAEFLGLDPKGEYVETQLESYLIDNLQKFLRELGKGYAFVERQQHIRTEARDYFIDLVFYNYILKCFVLVDLKVGKVTHQDVGQMDMYVRMYDELKRGEGDNPTLGIVLCAETDEDIARYSILHDSDQIFASKYQLYLPSEEDLRAEIEAQKEFFYLQQKQRENDGQMEGEDERGEA